MRPIGPAKPRSPQSSQSQLVSLTVLGSPGIRLTTGQITCFSEVSIPESEAGGRILQ
jgi:hypothetical protein